MHKITYAIEINPNIVYPMSMLEQVVGIDAINKYNRDGMWWSADGKSAVGLDREFDDTFHCWKEDDGEICAEGLGAMSCGYRGERMMDAVEQMWDNWGDEANNPTFYYTLVNED